MKKENAITLVALIITIIILLILATVSISLVINNGILDKSSASVFRSEIQQYNEELKIAIADDTTAKLGFRDEKFNVRRSSYDDENTFSDAMKSKIPSFNNKYANKLEIKEDQLQYIGEDEQEKQWLEQIIRVAGILKISYVLEDGTEAAPAYQNVIADGSYEVESPKKEGYEPDHYVVAGEINGDTNITVTYYPLSDGLEYELLEDGTYTVAGPRTYLGETLVIPAKYQEKDITQIKANAFQGNKAIKTLIVPSTVKLVKVEAFYDCDNLKKANLDAEKIERQVFESCERIEMVILGKNIQSIGNQIFWGTARYLTEIEIHTEQADISTYNLDAANLKKIILNDSNNKYLLKDEILYSKDGKKIHLYPRGKNEETFIIPESVTEIGQYAFYGNSKLKELNIPSTIITLGKSAFYNCGNIEKINVDSQTIENGAFEICHKLKNVTIGKNVKKIGSAIFERIQNLEEITYLGTMEEWNNININGNWKYRSNISRVICSDGTVDV